MILDLEKIDRKLEFDDEVCILEGIDYDVIIKCDYKDWLLFL